MATYADFTRSNYFEVKDPEAFRQLVERFDCTLISKKQGDITLYGFYADDLQSRCPCDDCEDESDGACNACEHRGARDSGIEDHLPRHLVDGYVAVLITVGRESARYVVGRAVAVNNEGKTVCMHLDQIYEQAKGLGRYITESAY